MTETPTYQDNKKTITEVMNYLKEHKSVDVEKEHVHMIGKILTRVRSNHREKPTITHFYPTYIIILSENGKPKGIVHLEELISEGIQLKLYVKIGRIKYTSGDKTKYAKIENNHVKVIVKPGLQTYQGHEYFDYSIRDLEPAELAYVKAYKTTHKAVQKVEEEVVMVDPNEFMD